MPHLPFHRLQADLADLIAKAPPGARLPSEPDLAKQLGVSRATLRESMRMFEAQGAIRRRQGAGTFIIGQAPLIASGLEVLESPDTMAQRLGMKASVAGVLMARIPADAQRAAVLEVPLKHPLLQINRILRVDGHPVAYVIDTLSEDILRPEELSSNFNGSVLDYLTQRGDRPTVSRTEISAGVASVDIARILEIQHGDVVLQFSEKLYSSAAKVMAYSFSCFVPGYFNFHVVRRVGGV